MVMSMFRINVARSDSFITACPVAKRHHFSWGIACRGRQPSIPWAQQRVFAVRTPVLQNSCIWRTKSREKSPLHHQTILSVIFKHREQLYAKSHKAFEEPKIYQKCSTKFQKTTNLFETKGAPSFFVCITKVPLFLTLSLHVW